MPLTTVDAGLLSSQSQQTWRNRIINGAMVIDQRNNGASITPTDGQYSVDRWRCYLSAASKYSAQRNAGSVTPPAGFSNYLGATSLSAYSVTSSDYFFLQQRIEGFNFADMAWGTANAQTITLSFWVRSSLTGTFGGSLQNSAADRSYPFTYSISSANTWEQKTVTVAGDTSGTWVGATNGIGVSVIFSLGMGSTRSGTAGAWAASNFYSATGATSVVGTNGATFYITGVQLEKGSTATSFDYRPYGTELALCQRYYEVYYQDPGAVSPVGTYYNASNYFAFWYFKQEKRAAATVTRTSGSWVGATPTINGGISSASFNSAVAFYLSSTSGVRSLDASAEL